jgi:uncharacterized membrane protein
MLSLLIVVTLLLVLIGCSQNEGIVMTEKHAYLQFLGDATNIEISIDDKELDIEKYRKNIVKNHFQYDPGYHQVEIFRQGQLILKQTVLLERGKITQVNIP